MLATGYEQVRSVVAYLTGDLTGAKEVHLELPETSVYSVNLANCCEDDTTSVDNCESASCSVEKERFATNPCCGTSVPVKIEI